MFGSLISSSKRYSCYIFWLILILLTKMPVRAPYWLCFNNLSKWFVDITHCREERTDKKSSTFCFVGSREASVLLDLLSGATCLEYESQSVAWRKHQPCAWVISWILLATKLPQDLLIEKNLRNAMSQKDFFRPHIITRHSPGQRAWHNFATYLLFFRISVQMIRQINNNMCPAMILSW